MKKVIRTKKLILILVEGKSDEASLEYVLSNLVKSEKVKFVICRGDITSDNKTTTRNVNKKITAKIKEFLDSSNGLYSITDVNLIVHIMDTDACSIDECNIVESDKNEYQKTIVNTTSKNNILKRNRRKLAILRMVSSLNYLSFNINNGLLRVFYKPYYMSCNLEHVLHNDPNIDTVNGKEYYSMRFSANYIDKISEFVKFINSANVGTNLSFIESWRNILKPENALKRETNLNLFVNDYVNEDQH